MPARADQPYTAAHDMHDKTKRRLEALRLDTSDILDLSTYAPLGVQISLASGADR